MNRLLVSAAALLFGALPAHAQSLVGGKVQTGTPSYVPDQNVPLSLDTSGALRVTGGAGSGGSTGSVTAPGASGTQAQAVQGVTGGVPLPIQGGNATAVKTDGTGTTQPVSAVSLPLPSGASTAANQASEISALGTTGDAAYAGSGTASIIAALKGVYTAAAAPTPAGSNVIGRVGIDQTTNGFTNGVFVLNLNQTAGGTASGNAIAIQGVANGSQIGVPVGAAEIGSSLPTAAINPTVTQSGTSVVGKTSQGNLYSAYAVNSTATAGYLACINATAAPSAGAAITPIDVATLAGTIGATAAISYGAGPPNGYSAGITCLVTTSLTTYTAGGASFIQARVR